MQNPRGQIDGPAAVGGAQARLADQFLVDLEVAGADVVHQQLAEFAHLILDRAGALEALQALDRAEQNQQAAALLQPGVQQGFNAPPAVQGGGRVQSRGVGRGHGVAPCGIARFSLDGY